MAPGTASADASETTDPVTENVSLGSREQPVRQSRPTYRIQRMVHPRVEVGQHHGQAQSSAGQAGTPKSAQLAVHISLKKTAGRERTPDRRPAAHAPRPS